MRNLMTAALVLMVLLTGGMAEAQESDPSDAHFRFQQGMHSDAEMVRHNTIPDYDDELSMLNTMGPQLRAIKESSVEDDDPMVDRLARVARFVVDNWPMHLKGYDYRVLVQEGDHLNAFAIPTGVIGVSQGLMRALDDDELAAVIAHEIAHVEYQHSYIQYRNGRRGQWLAAAAGVAAGVGVLTSGGADWEVRQSTYDTASLAAMIGSMSIFKHGRDREMEADATALAFLHESGLGVEHLTSVHEKLKAAHPESRHGPFASHPDTDERIELASNVMAISMDVVCEGRRDGELVAQVDPAVQVKRGNEWWIFADVHATWRIERRDNINDLKISYFHDDGRRFGTRSRNAKEKTAERINPGGSTSAIFITKGHPIREEEDLELKIRRARDWQCVDPEVSTSEEFGGVR